MDLVEVAITGMEYWTNVSFEPRMVDAVILSRSKTLLLLDYWWRADELMQGTHFYVIQALPEEMPGGWSFRTADGAALTTPATQDGENDARERRRVSQYDRSAYLAALERFREGVQVDPADEDIEADEAWDFDPWIAAFLDLPELDPVEDYKRVNFGRRPVSLLRAVDNDGRPVDAAAFDDLGQAASVRGEDGPLSGLVSAFILHAPADRPSAAQFTEWAKEQRLYGPYSIDAAQTTEAEGDIESIASRALTLTL